MSEPTETSAGRRPGERPPAVWQAPDGTFWNAHVWEDTASLARQVQDPETRQWVHAPDFFDSFHRIPRDEFIANYTPVAPEPMPEPRITRLTELVLALLDDFRDATGHMAEADQEVRDALVEVAWIPLEARRKALGAAQNARRAGYNDGRRGR